MPQSTIQPNAWVALKLHNGSSKMLQMVPNTTVSLGKYGSFPGNLLLDRPYHITYEVQEKIEGESFSRLRVVSGTELNADALVDTTALDEAANSTASEAEAEAEAEADVYGLLQNGGSHDDDAAAAAAAAANVAIIAAAVGEELALVAAADDDDAAKNLVRQTLTTEEIEELKRKGAGAGKEIVAKLLLRHTAIDQKTAFSLAKYKLLKEKKYVRRFTVLPMDVPVLAPWMLEEKDAGKILEMRPEALALVGCWADVHFGGNPVPGMTMPHGGRWLAVDDTGGLLVAAMAERMGILYPNAQESQQNQQQPLQQNATGPQEPRQETVNDHNNETISTSRPCRKRPHKDDLAPHYALTNTITLIHANSQPNLSLLRYFGFDSNDVNPQEPHHPLFTQLLPVSWLQVVSPDDDPTYAEQPAEASLEELMSWKTNRRGNYHRKRRRWARTRHIVDCTRAGGFSGLAVASTMDPISILRSALPLLAGGSPVAVYSPTVEPLTQLADCFSIGRRGAWVAAPPSEIIGQTLEELEAWPGSVEFPINPTLLVGVSVQTSRAKRWQVLPGRTHPLMMSKGGAEGYILTGWRAVPAQGRISARGKYQKRGGKVEA